MATDNPVVGEIVCNDHGRAVGPKKADVKLSLVRDKLYIHCRTCGIEQKTLPTYQDYIQENAVFHGEYKEMYGIPESPYKGGGEPEEKPETEAKKEKSIFSFLTDEDEE